jgi:DNA-binding MarR family transcriptional regulator
MSRPAEPATPVDAAPLPDYLDSDHPLAMYTRLQRVGLHLERLQREAIQELDIAPTDFMVLATLRREGEPYRLPVTRIAQLVLQPMGGISQRIDRLERRGLVARSLATDDRRKVLVQLTDAGLDVAVRGGRSYDRVRQRVLADVPEAQRAAIDAAVRVLFAAMERDAVDHAG